MNLGMAAFEWISYSMLEEKEGGGGECSVLWLFYLKKRLGGNLGKEREGSFV